MRKIILLLLLCLVVLALSKRDRGGGGGRGRGRGGSKKNRGSQPAAKKQKDPKGPATGGTGGGSGPKNKKVKMSKVGKPKKPKKIKKTGKDRKKVDWKLKVKEKREKQKNKPKKTNKGKKFRNENRVVRKGKVKKFRGTGKSDPIPKIKRPDFNKGKRWEKSCIREGSSFPGITGVSEGPAAEGVTRDTFKPCRKRKRSSKRKDNKKRKKSREKRSETYSSDSWYWPDPGDIPYIFHSSFPTTDYPNVRYAISLWEAYTCLKFTELTAAPSKPHIVFKAHELACATLRLGPNTFPPYETIIDANLCRQQNGSLTHEIGHALGLTHSQKRVDRDDYVKIFLDNIPANWTSQFIRDSDKYFEDLGVPYYYDSIMHYYPKAASKDGLRQTICPLDPLGELVMGQREEPAFGDIALINRMYCQESCFKGTDLGSVTFDDTLGQTISGRICQRWNDTYPHNHKWTTVGENNYCANPDNWAGGPWCYTIDPSTRYEPCFSTCEDLETAGKEYCDGYCFNGGYHDPDTCECICPDHASGPSCEVVDEKNKYRFLQCGGKIELLAGVKYGVTTPNWPANYDVNELCMWWIQVPDGFKVRLEIGQFNIEEPDSTGCYDYLEIRKDVCAAATTDKDDMRYCGDMLSPGDSVEPFVVLSEGPDMILKFYSDESDPSQGFNMVISAIEETSEIEESTVNVA